MAGYGRGVSSLPAEDPEIELNGVEWIVCQTRVLLGSEMAMMTSLVHSESVSCV